MDHCEVHKAFDSLWSVTDEIFKYVADIRTILNGAKGPKSEILSSDPPPYESSTPEQLIETLNRKVTCLENLNEKRKGILGEFSTATKSGDLDEKKQIRDKPIENVVDSPRNNALKMREEPSENVADSLRNNALKGLVSYTRTRHTVLTTNLDLLEQTCRKLGRFCDKLREPNTEKNANPNIGCSSESKEVFRGAMHISENVFSNLMHDREVLLREGKLLKERILKVPHETREETTEITEKLESTYKNMETIRLSIIKFLISPLLEAFLECLSKYNMMEVVRCMIVNMRSEFNWYIQNVQAFNEALQSLADHLHI